MSYTLKTDLSHRGNYGSKRSLSSIKYIATHFTANDGDSDENNGNYFNSYRGVSAHAFVDDDSVTVSVPDDYIAYSCGDKKYNNYGGTLHGIVTNANSYNIELCDTVKNGSVYPTQATIDNAIDFTKSKMVQYGIDKAHVIRHFDVSGKICPAYWCGTEEKDNSWKTEFHDKLVGWAYFGSNWYWLDLDGNVTKSKWIKDNGKWYYLNGDGIMETNKWIKNASGTWSYVNADGEAVTGWKELEWDGVKSWYYFDDDGTMRKNCWIDNYFLGREGAMVTNSWIPWKDKYYWVGDDGKWVDKYGWTLNIKPTDGLSIYS